MNAEPIAAVLAQHAERLMALPGVAAVGQGECDGQPCIKVYLAVENPGPELLGAIPRTLGGYLVEVRVSGEILARPSSPSSRSP